MAGTVVGSLWVVGGQSCPDVPLEGTLLVPAATFNSLATNGSLLLSAEASPTVSAAACQDSIIEVRVQVCLPADPARPHRQRRLGRVRDRVWR